MGPERSPSVTSRKGTSLNLHPVIFSCSQLFGMAPGEDGEKEASLRKLHGILIMSPVHGHVHREEGVWAWQVTLGVHFLGIPP